MASFNSAFLHSLLLLLLIVMLPSLATAGNRSRWLSGRSGGASLEEDETEGNGTLWAVLVAGSKDYFNCGHQADVCHAYQLLKKGGVKDKNVIVFMCDNIANNPENPRPGIIINNPKGEDVYSGLPKDYTGENATAENLIAVLLGNQERLQGGSGKILDSSSDDRIFIFYSGYGGLEGLRMPDYSVISADEFIKVLTEMHAVGSYKEMVIYANGPGSGTLFGGLLPKDLNIYATTSSNASENTMFSTYCPGKYPPAPHKYDVCIASLYSVSWMEDSKMQNRKDEILEEQYEIVKNRTYYNDNRGEWGTHVMEYGTLALRSKKLYLFQGSSDASSSADLSNLNNPVLTGVDQRDADLIYLQRKVIYLEAYEGGSIFEGLLSDDMNIYATTVSNATESSWGTYCPDVDPLAPPDFHASMVIEKF